MSLRIQNNVEAFNAHRNLSSTEGKLATFPVSMASERPHLTAPSSRSRLWMVRPCLRSRFNGL